MTYDIELAFCTERGRGDELAALVMDLADEARLAVLARLVEDELDRMTWQWRWTPYYDRALARVVDRWDVLWRHATDRASIAGFSEEDVLPLDVAWALALHDRWCAYLTEVAADGGRLLSDAWARCRDPATARLLLEALPGIDTHREPLRALLLEREPRLDETTDAYLTAALAASRGTGSWDAAERAYEAWARAHEGDWYTYDGGVIEWLERMSRLPRRDASWEDLCRCLEGVPLATIQRALGNPFAPRA